MKEASLSLNHIGREQAAEGSSDWPSVSPEPPGSSWCCLCLDSPYGQVWRSVQSPVVWLHWQVPPVFWSLASPTFSSSSHWFGVGGGSAEGMLSWIPLICYFFPPRFLRSFKKYIIWTVCFDSYGPQISESHENSWALKSGLVSSWVTLNKLFNPWRVLFVCFYIE